MAKINFRIVPASRDSISPVQTGAAREPDRCPGDPAAGRRVRPPEGAVGVEVSAIGAHVFRVLFEGLHDGYFVHDVEGRFIEVNDRTCADLGYKRHELMRLTINDISCGATP